MVVTDNTHNDTNTIPLSRVDWFHYGGLFRSVELMELDAAWIKDYRIDYTLDGLDTPNQAAAALEINVTVQSFSASGTHELRVYLDDRLLAASVNLAPISEVRSGSLAYLCPVSNSGSGDPTCTPV